LIFSLVYGILSSVDSGFTVTPLYLLFIKTIYNLRNNQFKKVPN